MLELCGISKSFTGRQASVLAIRDVDLNVDHGEFFILLGPSGCGKTTMLRSIAGLERPDSGVIKIDGKIVFAADQGIWIRPEFREIAMVFQSYAIWPHMNVYDNIAFPLREGVRRIPQAEARRRTDEMLELFGLSDMAKRPATALSGGQQQRVALARALALRPKVLLMDEPLSNLDLALQTRLRVEIKKLVRDFRVTTVYVTHNQAEAMEMGDRLAVVSKGNVVQCGTPTAIYGSPEGEFTARFIGEISLLPARLAGQDSGFAVLDTTIGRMRARAPNRPLVAAEDRCFLGVRPEDFVLLSGHSTPDADANIIEGEVIRSRFTGDSWVHTVLIAGSELAFKTHHTQPLTAGTRVRLGARPTHCVTIVGHGAGLSRDPSREALGLQTC